MGRQSSYKIGIESVSDYLVDIERRWGVRLAFTFEAPRSLQTLSPYLVWLRMPHEAHQREITWWNDMLCVPEPPDHHDIVHIMWDMCHVADEVLRKGPQA